MGKFSIKKYPKTESGILSSPVVQIELSEFSKDEGGSILLTPKLMSESEIEHSFNDLIDQLMKLKKDANKFIKQHMFDSKRVN